MSVPAHRRGTLTTWSFYHPHHLPAHGGGAVVCPDAGWRQQLESLVHWGRACTCPYDPEHCPAPEGIDHFFTYVRPGLNLAMSELNACFGRYQLARWHDIEVTRKARYDLLYAALAGSTEVKVYPRDIQNGSPFVFPITLKNGSSAEAAAAFAKAGIECRSLMGGSMTRQPGFAHLPNDGTPNAERMAAQSFFVGIHQTLPMKDVEHVAAALAAAYAPAKRQKTA